MKISTILLLTSIWCLRVKIANANYRRVIRGPPQPPRPPPPAMANNMKKWHMQAHRHMPRPRPIPVHMPHNFKVPVGPPNQQMKHQIPMRMKWPGPQPIKILTTAKPFLSSPPINLPEYDYHIQTNSIPNHPNMIKQIDEKGPIHTIPAPNLSLADRPKHVEEYKPQAQVYTSPQFAVVEQQFQQSQVVPQHTRHHNEKTIVQVQKVNQYQVTEPSEHQLFYVKFPVSHAPDPSQTAQRNLNIQDSANQQAHAEFLVAPQEPTPSTQMTPQELYKLLNMYPQQEMLDTYSPPQQSQFRNHYQMPNYQGTVADRVPAFLQNIPKKLPVQPQFQLFDYNEQEQRNLPNQISSRVTADYNVNPIYDENEALAQAQFVQHFYDTRNENLASNKVEPEIKETLDTYYSSLPNQQAAEALLTLQEAGQLNNKENNMEASSSVPISIYVPDSDQFDESDENERFEQETPDEKALQNYEGLSQEDEGEAEHFEGDTPFGKRQKARH